MPQQQPDQEQQQPSEVQIILDDALTDLEALVDRYLPGTSRDGGFAGRMMAAIEQVGASATQSIGGVVEPLLVSPSPSRSPSGRGGQPVRSRSNASGSRASQYYSESSVEVSYDERTDDSAYDTHDTRSCYSSASASEELKPVTAVVVRNRDKSRSNNGAMGKDELMNQTIDTAANTTVDALDTSYFTQDDEAEEPATIPTAAPSPSSKVVTDVLDMSMDMDMDETAEIDRPLPESPRRRAEREADEAAERLAHRSYFSKRSSFDQLLDEGANNHHKTNETPQTNTQSNTRPVPPKPTNGKTVADKTQHELVQKYRLEKKQQMVAEEGTAPDDEFAFDAGVERRREERRAEERRRLAAVAEHRRRLKYNAQKLREANAAAAAAVEEKTDKAGTPPPGLNASDDGESTDDSLADELQSMVVTDLD